MTDTNNQAPQRTPRYQSHVASEGRLVDIASIRQAQVIVRQAELISG